MKKQQIVFFAILLIGFANSQTWKIQRDNGSKRDYDKLIKIENDTLYVELSEKITGVPIKNIQKITHRSKYRYDAGLVGCAIGGLAGLVIGAITVGNESGISIGVATGTVAGFMLFTNLFDKRFDLAQRSNEEKKDIINAIITIYNE